jgi:hypothetical protein
MQRPLVFDTGGKHTAKKRAGSEGAGPRWVGLLRRRDGCNRLQAEGNDLGTDHFARDD